MNGVRETKGCGYGTILVEKGQRDVTRDRLEHSQKSEKRIQIFPFHLSQLFLLSLQ